MRRRYQFIGFSVLALLAVLLYIRSRSDGIQPGSNSVAKVPLPLTVNPWLRAAYQSAHAIEDDLDRDEILSRLVTVLLKSGDRPSAVLVEQQIHNEPRKASALVELAISARRNGQTATYRQHMDAAFQIADTVYTGEEQSGYVHKAIAATLMRNGYVEDAVAVAFPVCTNDTAWEVWSEWFRESVEELALRGNTADASYIAGVIPWPVEGTRAYIDIALIQHRDGHGAGSSRTLKEAIERIGESNETNNNAYSYALIAAAAARMGDHTNATNLYAMSQACLPVGNAMGRRGPGGAEVAARTLAELARTSCQLGDPQEARRWLGLAARHAESLGASEAAAVARGDIADVWMSMDQLDAALGVADELRGTTGHTSVLGRIILHQAFPTDVEIVNRVMGSVGDAYGQDEVALCLALSSLRRGNFAEAERFALTIRDKMSREEAFSGIIENLCERGSIECAIQMASERIQDPGIWIDLFISIGKGVAFTRSGAEVHTFLSGQTDHLRRSAACIGIAVALGDNDRPNKEK